jgi:putative oxidoreductase
MTRCLLVVLFLPFSALDKILNTRAAVAQAGQVIRPRTLAVAFIIVGGIVEVTMPLAILTGFADRLAAFMLGGYCLTTALLWKQFWNKKDFRLAGASKGREMFWDFLKNVGLAGAFFLLSFGTDVASARKFLSDPFASTHPYQISIEQGR